MGVLCLLWKIIRSVFWIYVAWHCHRFPFCTRSYQLKQLRNANLRLLKEIIQLNPINNVFTHRLCGRRAWILYFSLLRLCFFQYRFKRMKYCLMKIIYFIETQIYYIWLHMIIELKIWKFKFYQLVNNIIYMHVLCMFQSECTFHLFVKILVCLYANQSGQL